MPLTPKLPADAAATRQLVLRALRQTSLFAEWPAEVLDRLAAESRLRAYSAGREVPFGARGLHEVVVVVAGRLEVNSVGPQGRRHVISLLGPGQISGLVRLLDAPVLPAHYRAMEPTSLVHIPCQALSTMLDAQPALWRGVALLALARQRFNIQARHHHAVSSTQRQLASTLLVVLERHGLRERDAATPPMLQVSQAELAAMVGVTRITARKALLAMAQAGLLDLAYGRITLRDLPGLRALAR